MAFSEEWESIYCQGKQNSVWPWSDLISLVKKTYHKSENLKVLELGCGAGANIPFFISEGWTYYGIDGSNTEIKYLKRKFQDYSNVKLFCGDFTKEINCDKEKDYDLIFDRASLTHNSSEDIKNAIKLVTPLLKTGGNYIGVDWFSTNYDEYEKKEGFIEIDRYSRVFCLDILEEWE